MSFQIKQSMKLSQQLRMTPQLQQAIKLLQLSRMELETAVRKELDENPILDEHIESPEEESRVEKLAKEDNVVDESAEQAAKSAERGDDFEWESYVDQNYKPTQGGGPSSEEIMNYENVISTPQSLYDYLNWQANLAGFNDEELVIAQILIGYVDDDGYIKTPFDAIAQEEGVTVQELEEILPFVQEFDPPGVGARDLQECLLLQAKVLQEDTHDLVFLIKNHLKDLEKKNFEGIAKAMNRDLKEIIDMCKIIFEMDPKPGRQYAPNETQYVTPDVYVYQVGEEYVVSLNEDGLPRLKISNFYKNVLKSNDANKVTQEYIQDKLKAAVWLIKAIHQRQRTIYKVTESIVRHQREFFDKGPAFIRPMILRDIASDIGMHESTISRVTTSKYVHTPRGIFELKYFFNSGIARTSGDALASESVKLKIKEMIAKEDPKSPLSDQKIVEILQKEGIEIARRTVAKYRDMLAILPSSKRKKYF
ncbi:MAG: RNA polymerase factor sigma-54 [Bdellovibrionales bacterium]